MRESDEVASKGIATLSLNMGLTWECLPGFYRAARARLAPALSAVEGLGVPVALSGLITTRITQPKSGGNYNRITTPIT